MTTLHVNLADRKIKKCDERQGNHLKNGIFIHLLSQRKTTAVLLFVKTFCTALTWTKRQFNGH